MQKVIKFRINPVYCENFEFEQKSKSIKFTDTFYDDPHGQRNEFYRNRFCFENAESSFIQQDSSDSPFGVHCYNKYNKRTLDDKERGEIQNDLKGIFGILSYDFERFHCDAKNIYKDVINTPIQYEVISVLFELNRCDTEMLKSSLGNAFNYLIDMLSSKSKLLPDALPFPTFSKFMYMIQFSEHSFYYDVLYKQYDPAVEFIMPRIKYLIENFSPIQIPREVKLYMAIVTCVPNLFKAMMVNKVFQSVKMQII
jgi:hypothetical protein